MSGLFPVNIYLELVAKYFSTATRFTLSYQEKRCTLYTSNLKHTADDTLRQLRLAIQTELLFAR